MLWGTTFIGHSLPWADIGEGVTRIKTGLLVGKSLWLWLGVLDAIQGVGLGMLLLQVCPSASYPPNLNCAHGRL
jgi:alpha-1,3-glucan synthase